MTEFTRDGFLQGWVSALIPVIIEHESEHVTVLVAVTAMSEAERVVHEKCTSTLCG